MVQDLQHILTTTKRIQKLMLAPFEPYEKNIFIIQGEYTMLS